MLDNKTTDRFRDAINGQGLTPPADIIPNGEIHRYRANGDKRNTKNAWYVLYGDDLPAGAFGNWKTGESFTWCSKSTRGLSAAEKAELKKRMDSARQQREAEIQERNKKASREATKQWQAAEPASAEHPYLLKKKIKQHGVRKGKGNQLLIPVRNGEGKLRSLQFISEDGAKMFLPGGAVTENYYSMGKPKGCVLVAEGFATGASLLEATGHAVAVAFNAGNLLPVARTIRGKYPNLKIIICGDNDMETGGNPGVTKATEAAERVGAHLAIPTFKDTESNPSDFNDLANLDGHGAVREQVENAKEKVFAVFAGQQGGTSEKKTDLQKPIPLPEGLPGVEPFTYRLLPDRIAPWVQDICDRVQCPPDYVAVTVMVALGSIIGRKVGIRPQAQTDWTVTPNQWALLIGRPGVLKSPAMEAALAPVKRLAAKAQETYEGEIQAFTQQQIVTKLKADAGEKEARSRLKKNLDADVSYLLAIDKEETPSLKRYIVNDTSAASLGELHRQNHNGLLVYRDELVSLLKTLERDDNSEARGFYLTGWNGDSPYTFDRIGRGMNLHIPAVCLSLLGSTQPGRISKFIKAAVNGGTGDDGLLQRFGLVVWPDTGSTWKDVDRWPDNDAKREAFKIFNYLDNIDPIGIHVAQDTGYDGGPDGIPYLRFDDEGLNLFREWRSDLETRLRSGDLHPALESHLAKYRKLVPGLALIIHLTNGYSGPIGRDAVLKALAWSEYLESHARRLYASLIIPEVSAAESIIKKIRSGALASPFVSWQVWRPGWAGLSDRQVVTEALQLLVDYSWLVVSRKDTGGRPSDEYEVNPEVLK